MKKKWTMPKLIILLKGRPEESVLNACKTFSGNSGPSAEYNGCFYRKKFGCQKCKQESPS